MTAATSETGKTLREAGSAWRCPLVSEATYMPLTQPTCVQAALYVSAGEQGGHKINIDTHVLRQHRENQYFERNIFYLSSLQILNVQPTG